MHCDLIPLPYKYICRRDIKEKGCPRTSAEEQKVQGNASACMAESSDEVREQMMSSMYYQKVELVLSLVEVH